MKLLIEAKNDLLNAQDNVSILRVEIVVYNICIQWNLRIMDTLGTLFGGCPFVRGRNVWTVNGRGQAVCLL